MRLSFRNAGGIALIAFAGSCASPVELTTGLTGTVVRGPVTPVCQVDVPCDQPFAATFRVFRGGRVVAAFQSDVQGHFTVALAPGAYTIVPGDDAPIIDPASQARTIDVLPEGITSVQLDFDTGIR